MTEKLDPYTKLLGLPPGPRPPHLYALLGLEPYCHDMDAIMEASRRQMACIKPYEDHPESALRAKVQEVMNQIGLARAVLRDPRKRAEYDRRLAEILGRRSVVAEAPEQGEAQRTAPAPQADPAADTALDLQALPQAKAAKRALVLNIVEALSGSTSTVQVSRDKESILGRNDDCDICIEHASVCPRHARLTYRQGHWHIAKEDRRGDILVNGQRCTQALLSDGDQVTIGAYEINVEVGQD